jgi:hypothetical protein
MKRLQKAVRLLQHYIPFCESLEIVQRPDDGPTILGYVNTMLRINEEAERRGFKNLCHWIEQLKDMSDIRPLVDELMERQLQEIDSVLGLPKGKGLTETIMGEVLSNLREGDFSVLDGWRLKNPPQAIAALRQHLEPKEVAA